ncbi:MAG: diaminopimelate decarboxylase [Desulfobacterales bacterium]|nr:diaminopimelate decarboxylase [Desulfobacterales bacterium]MBF0398878.1 diaminopimelate decarboxylase [Desulfobacterales bacterium]
MHHFQYQDNILYCENVPIPNIAAEVGTPFYLYSHATLKHHFLTFDSAFDGIDRLVCFSVKANNNIAILKLFASLGSGLDIVSGGELYKGLKAGFSADKIIYSGVGKRIDEIDFALKMGILMFNIESMEELEVINERAAILNKKASISFRVNPDVDPKTHPYISTGLKKNKFGINIEKAIEGYKRAKELQHIEIIGLDCHIGSQITEIKPFEDAIISLKSLYNELKNIDINIKYLDIGGGLGIPYSDESPPLPSDYAKAIKQHIKDIPVKLILEPGRVIVGNSGILVCKVLYRKSSEVKEFVIVDAGMNDLIRPSLYKAYHEIKPVIKNNNKEIVVDIVGPICETGDFLACDRKVADLKKGDLIAVMSSGAYGYAMCSNYCARLKLPELIVSGNQFHVIRTREIYEDLLKNELIPQFML